MTRMRKQVLQEGRTQGDVQAPGKCTVRRVQNTHFGMYSGTWVWYDTTSGIASSLAYRMEPNTSRPAVGQGPGGKLFDLPHLQQAAIKHVPED